MLTIVLNGTGEYKAVMVPASRTMNNTYFMEYVLGLLTKVCYSASGKSHQRRMVVLLMGGDSLFMLTTQDRTPPENAELFAKKIGPTSPYATVLT
jgi:hypothetical protein